jgi:two-component system response regulator YesN
MKLLIVDDEVLIRQWVVFCLERSKLALESTDEAANGKEALERISESRPDIIIADIKMPIMDGLQLLQEVKKLNPPIEVILLTGHAEFEYAKQGLKWGAADYLLKAEINEKELIEALKRVMSKERKTPLDVENTEELSVFQYGSVITRAIAYMEQNYANPFSLKEIADYVHLHANYFSQLFKEKTGTNFNEYLTEIRLKKSKYYLLHTDLKSYEISDKVGYPNYSYFSKVFKKIVGVSPNTYRSEALAPENKKREPE